MNHGLTRRCKDRVWPIITNLDALAISEAWHGHPGTLKLGASDFVVVNCYLGGYNML